MTIAHNQLKQIIEGALLAAGQPMDVKRLLELFTPEDSLLEDETEITREDVQAALQAIVADCEGRGFELREVSSGWRFQVRSETAQWVNRLWEEKPQRYSRAMLETLALIAYRQPITRGDIEEIRGVAVSSHIIKTLAERDWVKVVGHRDVPGRPSLYATTRTFLDYFNLNSLEELPSLGELADLDQLNSELNLEPSNDQGDVQSQPNDSDSADEAHQDNQKALVGGTDGDAEASSEIAADPDQAESEAGELETPASQVPADDSDDEQASFATESNVEQAEDDEDTVSGSEDEPTAFDSESPTPSAASDQPEPDESAEPGRSLSSDPQPQPSTDDPSSDLASDSDEPLEADAPESLEDSATPKDEQTTDEITSSSTSLFDRS
ncbi:SMC-Scp complex subunit ScpB [Halioxenophilus aromaticivorans]|uniref:SMC-Scp complex subunit ScpB n=1 Tax=Halioxenophilus aromaticivorans TaxID=1306992 RepID=A0AAV3TXQ1_9ALTE